MTGGRAGEDRAVSDARKEPRCPVCGRPRDPAWKPFCSKRCKDVDLSRWLTGAYAIAGEPDVDDEEG